MHQCTPIIVIIIVITRMIIIITSTISITYCDTGTIVINVKKMFINVAVTAISAALTCQKARCAILLIQSSSRHTASSSACSACLSVPGATVQSWLCQHQIVLIWLMDSTSSGSCWSCMHHTSFHLCTNMYHCIPLFIYSKHSS